MKKSEAATGKPKKNHRLKFTETEDNLLRLVVSKTGTDDWQLVASWMGCRTARQCRDRWKHYLSPMTNTNEWTPAEDQLLVENYKLLGSHWGALASLFPGRTSVGVRNRCCKLLKMKESTENKNKLCIKQPFPSSSSSDLSSPSSPCESTKILLPPISTLPFPSFVKPNNSKTNPSTPNFSADFTSNLLFSLN
ncbi:hypothetical protein M9Y10_010383 [Tritrichomonas musculus]|uniref:Myb-like DNA-binding domain containing protein n=1 Tax=Tritrichomonas musculus TaxID=1915356 RepID=A0ABR2IME2_9EUKA